MSILNGVKMRKLAIILGILILTSIGLVNATLTDNLIGYWSMDDVGNTYIDSAGNYNLIAGGNAPIVAGILGNAKSFTTATDYGYNSAIYSNGQNLTSCFWTYSYTGGDGYNTPFAYWVDGGQWGHMVSTTSVGDGYLRFTSQDNPLSVNVWGTSMSSPDPIYPLDTWNHVCVSSNSSYGIKVYFNGVNVYNYTAEITDMSLDNTELYIGVINSVYDHNANAIIDEVGFWNRTLNDIEISTLCNDGYGFNPFNFNIIDGIITYWKMDEVSGTNIEDSVGNYNGTIISGTTIIPAKINRGRNFTADTNYFTADSNTFGRSAGTICYYIRHPAPIPIYEYFMDYNRDGNGLLLWDSSGWNIKIGGYMSTNPSDFIVDENWHQYCNVYTINSDWFYIDGILNYSDIGHAIRSTTSDPGDLYVGTLSYGGAGIIFETDEIGFWDRALNYEQIYSLYTITNNGTSYPFIPISCVEDWIRNDTVCNGFTRIEQYYDNASCGTTTNLPVSNGTIYSCTNCTISSSGIYTLNSNSNGCTITANNVNIQGNGYTINGIIVNNRNGLIINNTKINGTIIYPTPSTPDFTHQVLILYNTNVSGEIQMWGTRPHSSGDQGNSGGELTAYNSVLGNIIAYGGTGTYTGAPGGTVTLSNSISGDIDVHAVSYHTPVKYSGGTIILYSSNTGNLNLAGTGCPNGNGGTLTRTTDSITGIINNSGCNPGPINVIPVTPIITPPTYENQTFNNVTTTDLATVPDIQAVENFTIASSTSSVQWTNPVNLENVTNIASVIITTQSFIAVNKQVVPSLDTPADVALTPPSYGNPCQNFILYYSPGFYTTQADIVNNGQIVATAGNIGYACNDPTICTNVQCTNGVLTFRAEHFDGFAIGQVDAATKQSCSGTRSIIYAGFALLAVLVIAGAVALILLTLNGGNIDTATIASLMIGLGVIIMIGFIVIYYVSQSLC